MSDHRHTTRRFGPVLITAMAMVGWPQMIRAEGSEATIRVATYNVAMYRERSGQLAEGLEGGADAQARKIAEVIQRVRPDLMLLCEIDYDPANDPAVRFAEHYLSVSQQGLSPIDYPHIYQAPVNTGVPSGADLDNDGTTDGPNDCFGFGRYPGQYGMAVLSRWPIDREATRTFQKFLWRDMPGHRRTLLPGTKKAYYSDTAWRRFRLSSKSLWDVEIESPRGELHLICSHPTPPVFDGPEDRNGLRNADEIRMLVDYVTPGAGDYLVDDQGRAGEIGEAAPFVVLGDLNADPVDGNAILGPINALLRSPHMAGDPKPKSPGAVAASHGAPELNVQHRSDPALDTGDFGPDGHANLRIDYALPSKHFKVVSSGVHWPSPGEPGSDAVKASDHRLVWVDVALD